MLKRTPFLALIIGAAIMVAVVLLVEDKSKPFTALHYIIFAISSYLPAMGLALFFDPNSKAAKEGYLKINFYAPDSDDKK